MTRAWTVVIPLWHPSSLNRLLGNPWEARRRKKADAIHIALFLTRAGVPRVSYPRSQLRDAKKQKIDLIKVLPPIEPIRRRLDVEILLAPEERDRQGRWVKGGQEYDADNLSKSIRDALVEGGWLVDDNRKWLESREPRQRRSRRLRRRERHR